MFNSFFNEMEKSAGAGDKALSILLKHPGKVAAGLGGLGLAGYLAPKLYYLSTEEEKKKRLKINNAILAQILQGQLKLPQADQSPKRSTFDPIVY